MTQQELNARRAMLVRRWVAYRVGRAQREIWRRRGDMTDELDEEIGAGDPLVDLPEALLG